MFDDTIKLQWQVAFVLVLDHRIQSHYKFAPHKYQYLLDYDHSNPHSNRKKNYNLILCDDKLEIINSFLLDILIIKIIRKSLLSIEYVTLFTSGS